MASRSIITGTRRLGRFLTYLTACVPALGACGVDDRALLAGGGGSGGLSSSSGGNNSGRGGSDVGDVPIPVCVYDGEVEVEAECETLVRNPGFTENVAGWSAENVGAISEEWNDADAYDNESSGSLIVHNQNFKRDEEAKDGLAPGGAAQCLPATGSGIYDVAADIFLPEGQGEGLEGETFESVATLSLFFYSTADCSDGTKANYTTNTVAKPATWVHISGSAIAPTETRSLAVRLATLKPFRQFVFAAHFDNVLLRAR